MSDFSLPVGQVTIAQVRTPVSEPKDVVIEGARLQVVKPTIKTLEQMEIEHIEHALAIYDNNKFQAAAALGVTTKTLYNKLHAYGLFEKYRA